MLLLFTIFASTTARTTAAAKERHFVSANVRLAGKIPYPASSVDAGFVTLSVNLDETGKLTSVDILRDLPSVSGLAIAAVRSWTYSAATLDGKAVASTFTINILFDPGFLGADNILLQPPSKVSAISKKDPAYFPAQLNTATFAPYPASTKVQDAAGNVAKVVTLNDVPPLTVSATMALKNWSFSAASYDGTAIASQMVVAVVFRSPSATFLTGYSGEHRTHDESVHRTISILGPISPFSAFFRRWAFGEVRGLSYNALPRAVGCQFSRSAWTKCTAP